MFIENKVYIFFFILLITKANRLLGPSVLSHATLSITLTLYKLGQPPGATHLELYSIDVQLESTASYTGLLLFPAEGLRTKFVCPYSGRDGFGHLNWAKWLGTYNFGQPTRATHLKLSVFKCPIMNIEPCLSKKSLQFWSFVAIFSHNGIYVLCAI